MEKMFVWRRFPFLAFFSPQQFPADFFCQLLFLSFVETSVTSLVTVFTTIFLQLTSPYSSLMCVSRLPPFLPMTL